MSISLSLPKSVELKPRIVVIGVGGAGGNAVNNMISSNLGGVEFVVANTDAQALALSKADRRIQMGGAITQGLGAGMRPHVGEEAAEASIADIMEHLEGAHMLFVAAGMGGGTGTGAAPVIAKAARERGILTVAIVTKPFQFEGSKRMKLADEGIDCLYSCVDTLIVIPNQNLFRVATENTTMADAFGMADEVLNSGVRGVTDLMVVPGLINLDFADVRTVMDEMGKAMMGTGEATGDRRAIEAAESAISNPLLDDVSLKGAKGVLINITGGTDLTLYEVDEAASLIRGQVDPEANIIVGSALDSDLDGIVRVSVVATGVASTDTFMPIAPREEIASQSEPEFYEDETFEEEIEVEEEIVAEIPESVITEPAPRAPKEAPMFQKPAPAAYSYRQPEAANPSPAPAAQQPQAELPEVEPQIVVKRPFGFFGRKKSVPIAPRTQQNTAPTQTGDLFGSDSEDELEIPSFLRRQNR
jgi:cell division protein FtsZ